MANGDQPRQVKRGEAEATPLQPTPLIVWRGTAEGLARMPHSEQDPHDFGDGLYLTFQQWLGEQYARLRSSDTGGRPVVYQGETTWRELGRILDLTSGQTKREWEGFLDSEYVPGKTWRSIMPPANPNKNYWTVFSAFLEKTGRKLENYDTIVGPEYVRTGVQLCVRNPGIQQAVEGRFVEWDAKPVWIRVLNASGEPLDVNINFPGSAGEANRQFVKERFQAAEKAEREKPEPGEPALSQPPVVSPGARGVAGVLAALEIIRIGLELAAAIRDMPTAIQRKLDPIRRIWSFWNQYGVRCTVLGLLTGGNIPVRGLPGVPDGAVKPATGRILWGLSPDAFSKLDGDEIEIFVAFLDNFAHPDSHKNALEQNLRDLRSFVWFLHFGWQAAAIMPAEEEASACCGKRRLNTYWCARYHRIQSWWVELQMPETPAATSLRTVHYSLEEVLNRVRGRLMSAEKDKIARTASVTTPVGSIPRRSQYSLPVEKSRVLRYTRNDDRPFYSVMDSSKLGDENEWQDLRPSFYQVGTKDCGSPFVFAEAVLVTGADAETNAMLYATAIRRDWRSLVAGYEPTLSSDWPADPSDWVNVPLVYVERAHVS